MHKLSVMTGTLLLLAAATVAGAGETESLKGSASVGLHYTDLQDEIARVGEYLSQEDVEESLPDVHVDLRGTGQGSFADVRLLYRGQQTQTLDLGLGMNEHLKASFRYNSFFHNLDHDRMHNLQARELVWNATQSAYVPGGKQVYHTDNDPFGRYAVRYERATSEATLRLPALSGSKIYSRYDEQRRSGWRQASSIDHCAFCHVSADRRQVDELIKSWRAGAEGSAGRLAWNYEYNASDFVDRAQTPTQRWGAATHPAFGDVGLSGTNPTFPYAVEFASRLSFSDVTLPYAQGTTSERRSQHAAVKLDLAREQTLRAAYDHIRRSNSETGVTGKTDSYVASWAARPDAKTRLLAKLHTYRTKVDAVAVDLAEWRSGRPGGGQDFDWTRISAANRDVLQVDAAASRRWLKTGWIKAAWRHQVIDRDAMATSQTSYLAVEGDDVRVPATPYANKTTSDRLSLSFTNRYGRKGNSFINYAYNTVDKPFMNPTAMCEEGLRGENHNLDGNSSVYYFQRQRYGNGTSVPSQAHTLTARGSYQISARASLSGYLNTSFERNDELNTYELERTVLSPGLNLWAAPSDRLLLTLGGAVSKVESNANFCPPIFDG